MNKPNVAIVSMSEVAQSGRMDPGFHIAAQAAENQVISLRKLMDETQAQAAAITLAGVMEAQHLRDVLAPLRRGEDKRTIDAKELARIARDYPHLSLALLSADATNTRRALCEQADEINNKIDALDDTLALIFVAKPRAKASP